MGAHQNPLAKPILMSIPTKYFLVEKYGKGSGSILCIVVWLVIFPLIFAEVYIRNPRIIKKEELKKRTLTSNSGI